ASFDFRLVCIWTNPSKDGLPAAFHIGHQHHVSIYKPTQYCVNRCHRVLVPSYSRTKTKYTFFDLNRGELFQAILQSHLNGFSNAESWIVRITEESRVISFQLVEIKFNERGKAKRALTHSF